MKDKPYATLSFSDWDAKRAHSKVDVTVADPFGTAVTIENDGGEVTLSRSAILRVARMVDATTSPSK